MIRFSDDFELVRLEGVRELTLLPGCSYEIECPPDQVLRAWVASNGSVLVWEAEPAGDNGSGELLENVHRGGDPELKDWPVSLDDFRRRNSERH